MLGMNVLLNTSTHARGRRITCKPGVESVTISEDGKFGMPRGGEHPNRRSAYSVSDGEAKPNRTMTLIAETHSVSSAFSVEYAPI